MAYSDGATNSTSMIEAGFGILQRNAALLVAYGVVSAVAGALQKAENARHIGGLSGIFAAMFAAIFADLIAAAIVGRLVMSREGLVTDGAPLRIATFIAVNLMFYSSIFIGLVLLIVPGFLAIVRWLLAGNFVLARGMSFKASFEASRDATAGHRGEIFGALMLTGVIALIPYGVILLFAGGNAAYVALAWYSPLALFSMVIRSVIAAIQLAVMIGIFATLAGRGNHYDEVFG